MISRLQALSNIPAPDMRSVLISKVQTTGQIAGMLRVAEYASRPYAAKIARKLSGATDLDTCENIWTFIKKNIRYVKETGERQTSRTLNRILVDGYGDCKHMSTCCVSLLRASGIPVFFRLCGFNHFSKEPTHVFAVAVIDGKQIYLDCVLDMFDTEPGYKNKKDINPIK